MKKRRKKKGSLSGLHPCATSSSLPICSASARHALSLPSSLSCLHCCNCDLSLLHESSSLCLDILAHSCCDPEVHVEELNTHCSRLSICTQYTGPFLQVSPLIPHRQGFRPH
ncbi:hypothetical protein ATANTOWER_011278 [Ataeniobius toweri]|uniref:Uncharacterized protein n=1 Tax=Ataeniobius toweri TaxID=208326 RepID=A0ABU7C8U7_9TELE|nr:hypothetical protein [Ataeniobius toweri]